jgi:hypothetical protein
MPGAERNRSEREVILEPREKPLGSFEELTEACLPTLTARLWATCCWSATMEGAWKIGDHNFLIAEVRPDPQTCLYVQFWSEPHEPVDAEVCSGEWNPGAVRYVRQQHRAKIEALGYAVGGRAHNFQKELQIETSAEAETVAREVLGIFFEVFDYRGQWPLELKWHQGERAGHEPVHSSVTPGDVAKLAAHLGFEIEGHSRHEPAVHLRHGKKRFLAGLSGRIADGSLYSIVVLETSLTQPRAIDDAVVERINDTLRFARVSRAGDQALVLSMPLRLDGGVTVSWMANAFQHWLAAWRACERLLKSPRTTRGMKAKRRRPAGPTVH